MAEALMKEEIENKIFVIRRIKVMLDRDLAELYGVQTKVLNQAVKRHAERFPEDFMFRLTREEMKNWRSQIVTSNKEKMGIRRPPYAFTENGVAMLSSVLNSRWAIQVNIRIMRTFTKIREMLKTHEELRRKLDAMEKRFKDKFQEHDHQLRRIFEAIRKILEPPPRPKRRIGFVVEEDRGGTNQRRRR